MNRSTIQRKSNYRTTVTWGAVLFAIFSLPAAFAATDYSGKSDEELTALTAQWGDLKPADRRALLAEVRGRMSAPAQASNTDRPRVKITRRYGRIVRKPDGSVVVQTIVQPVQVQPVQVQPGQVSPGQGEQVQAESGQVSVQQQGGRITFGFGFERRSKRSPEPRGHQERVETVKGSGQEVANESGL